MHLQNRTHQAATAAIADAPDCAEILGFPGRKVDWGRLPIAIAASRHAANCGHRGRIATHRGRQLLQVP